MKTYQITVSKKEKYVWFRVPKTASVSVVNTLHNNTTIHFGFPFNLIGMDHGQYKPYEPEYDDCFKFTFVRNPWDKLLSTWKDKIELQWTGWSYTEPKEYHKWRINEFEKYKNKDFKYFVKTFNPSDERHVEEQLNLFDIDNIDYVGRFETIQQDFNTVCDAIGIPHRVLPVINTTDHKHYTEYYDDETRSIVASKYARDIEHFKYEFGD